MPHHRRSRLVRSGAVALAALAALTTAGCGAVFAPSTTPDGDPIPSQDDLYARVREVTQAARSGHVSGFLTVDGKAMTIDIEGAVDGSNQRFRQASDDGGRVTMLSVKGRTYLTGNWDYWTAAAGDPKAGDVLKGRQVLLSKKDLAGGKKPLDLGMLLDPMMAAAHSGLLSRFTDSVTLRRENDHEIWVIHEGDDEVWVDRATGHLVKTVTSGDEPSELTFDKWDDARRFRAPAKVFKR